MALIQLSFPSAILGVSTNLTVLLPPVNLAAAPYPTLYLLHGLFDDHTAWQRYTSIERYASAYNLAVVMPFAGRSYYTDMASGPAYWTYLTEELPKLLRAYFPLSQRREDTFAAGLSMGGYGAFKMALTYPERYAAAASLSGALGIGRFPAKDVVTISLQEFRGIFGDPDTLYGGAHDLFHLAEELSGSPFANLPLYLWCGKQDMHYPENIAFREHTRKMGRDLTFLESDGGHEWRFWDWQIEQVLRWLPLTHPSI